MDFQAMAQRVTVRYAVETLDMVGAVSGGRLLGAKDFLHRKFHNPAAWPVANRGIPFQLFKLRRVPFDLAEQLADLGTPASSFSNARAVWQVARQFADPKPFASSPR